MKRAPHGAAALLFLLPAVGVFAPRTEAQEVPVVSAYRKSVSFSLDVRFPAGLPVLVDPGTQLGRENLLFSERALWLYATGTRLGDMRRLIGQYGRTQSTVLPTGAYHLSLIHISQPTRPY